MPIAQFPPLALAGWQDTRDTIQGYSKVVGAIRGALAPRQKHSMHRSLRAAAAGLTTTPIPAQALTFEVLLNLAAHRLVISNSRGECWETPLRGQPLAAFCEQALAGLALMGVDADAELDRAAFADDAPGAYDARAVEHYWLALSQVDTILKRFRGELRQETGEVQLWPHHFDIAMLWFSGRLVPGADPASPRNADEQCNFGFSTGDEGIPEPYFYATAYPRPDELHATPWPKGVTWHNQGWHGAVLRYASLVNAADAEERLLTYWRTFQSAAASLMLG